MYIKKVFCTSVLVLMTLLCSPHFAKGAKDFGIRGLKFNMTKLETACQIVTDAEIKWYRGDLTWKSLVDEEGNFNWGTLDKQTKKILRHNIRIMYTLRSVHESFAPGSGKVDLGYKTVWRSAPPAPEYLVLYEDFVRQVVERYDGDGLSDAPFVDEKKNIKYYQIENEPGKKPDIGSNFWNGTASDYAELYLVAQDIIKQADPEAKVALSGFGYGAIEYSIQYGTSFPFEVFRILDERGEEFDVFDLHFYRDYKAFSADEALHPFLSRYPRFENKPVWVTETNVDKAELDPDYTTEAYNRFVAKDIVKRHAVLFAGKVRKVFWSKLADRRNSSWNVPENYWCFTGLTEHNDAVLTPKPAYYTYALLIQKIKGKKPIVRMESQVYEWVYKFGKDDNAVYIMWYDSPVDESKEVVIPMPWEQVLITRVISEPGVTEPETEIRPTVGGALQIILDNSPIFVEKY
jgi:hypothetical protein